MRTYRDAKLMAKALREAVAPQTPLSHAQALEIVARQFGYDDWNILAAKIGEAEASPAAGTVQTGVTLNMGIPILRIFDVEKAKEFYMGFLGFTMDWDHRYGPDFPVYRFRGRACSFTSPSIMATPVRVRPCSSGCTVWTPIAPN